MKSRLWRSAGYRSNSVIVRLGTPVVGLLNTSLILAYARRVKRPSKSAFNGANPCHVGIPAERARKEIGAGIPGKHLGL